MSLKYLQENWLNHLPGHLPMFDNPFSEDFFPNIQYKPTLEWLNAVSSSLIACSLWEKVDLYPAMTSFQVAGESDMVSPETPFL